MQMQQSQAHAPKVEALWDRLTTLRGPCIGCKGCEGVCAELIEALTLPDAILKDR